MSLIDELKAIIRLFAETAGTEREVMKYSELKAGMKSDGSMFGVVQKIYKKTVHVAWGAGRKWIYDFGDGNSFQNLEPARKK